MYLLSLLAPELCIGTAVLSIICLANSVLEIVSSRIYVEMKTLLDKSFGLSVLCMCSEHANLDSRQ
jgi:hypothetical protein